MRRSIIGIGIGLGLLGCAPDLSANGAQRCLESLECATDAVCYRGFCVPTEAAQSDAGIAPVATVDAASQPSTAQSEPRPMPSEHDAGITPTNEAIHDAASAATATSQSPDASAPQPGPSAPDPAVMEPKPQPGMPAQPSMPVQPAQDAGTVVVDLPGNCTLADCCEEARKSLEGDDDEGPNPGPGAGPKADEDDKSGPGEKKAKSCGCADPALLSGILCGLLGPLGVVP